MFVRRSASAFPIALLVACAFATPACGPATPERPPDVLLISIDTLRADHLGFAGHADARTPFLDGLAADAVVFEQATSAVPITLPSHATMLTGLVPARHGARENIGYRVPEETVTLAERLSAAGYQTGAFIGALPLAHEGGLSQGFDVYDDRLPDRAVGGSVAHREERPAPDVLAAAAQWLGRTDPARPVFAFIHLFDPHAPYERARPGDSLPSYDGEIAFVDQALATFRAGLEGDPRWEGAITVITSDHGEGLGEHDEQTHCIFTYQTTLHVPLVVHGPGRFEGRRVTDVVGLVDVTPTVLDLAGVAPLADADGRSLVPALRGEALPAREYSFESLFGLVNFDWAPLRGLRSGSLKLIDAPRPELYDLAVDPDELRNLHASRPDEARRLRERLDAMEHGLDARDAEVERERLAGLAALGYVSAAPLERAAAADRADPKDRIADYEAYQRAHGLAASGDLESAEALLASVESRFSRSPSFYLAWARFVSERGQAARAARLYRRCLGIDPENAEARLNLAVAYLQREQPDDALRELETLLAQEPEHEQALLYAGLVLSRMPGRGAQALALWRRFVAVAPDHPEAGEIRAAIAKAEGR